MVRYALTVAYDGSEFCGWQKQEPLAPSAGGTSPPGLIDPGLEAGSPDRVALRTVQAVVERAVRDVVREPAQVVGASRTDAGVHARGQVAAFSCSAGAERGRGWPAERGLEPLLRAINSRLPGDVLARAIRRVPLGFDPIGDCERKAYTYDIFVSTSRPLWRRGRVLHTWHDADAEAMDEAARRIEGRHDFAAFAAAGHGRASTVRTVFSCRVGEVTEPEDADEPKVEGFALPPGRLIRVSIEGDGFLYNMVRIIAGTLLDAGRGKISPEGISAIIESRDRRLAGQTLPPQGLCLRWVRYPEHATRVGESC